MSTPFFEYEVPTPAGAVELLSRFRALDFEQVGISPVYQLRAANGLSLSLYKPEYLEVYEGKRSFDSDELDTVRCLGSQLVISHSDLEILGAFLGCLSFPVRVHLPVKGKGY